MWKKLIIIIPLVVALLIPTLIISSSAASLTVIDDLVIDNFQARIGYDITENTYWSDDDCTLMRTLYPEKRKIQFMLNGPNGGEGILNSDTTRIFTYEIDLAMYVITNQRLDFEMTFSGEEGYFIGLGTEIYSKQKPNNFSVSSVSGLINYGSTMVLEDGKKIQFQILNVTTDDKIYVSFGFQQVYESHALLFDCYMYPGMTFMSQDNPKEYLVMSSTSFSYLFYNEDMTGSFSGFRGIGNIDGNIPKEFGISPTVDHGGLIIRAKLDDGSESGTNIVTKASVSFLPFWVKYKDTEQVRYEIDDTRWYRVQFILKLGNQGQICYVENLKNLKLCATTFSENFDIFPSTTFVDESTKVSYAHFDFDIRGSILNNAKWEFDFERDFHSTSTYKSYISFYLTTPFNLYARSIDYSEKRTDADFVLNAGANVDVGDFGASNIQILSNSLTNLESSYYISDTDIQKLNQNATNLLNNSYFRSASTVVTGFIDRFSVENPVFWVLLLCVLTLGLVFFFIGRGKG